MLFFYNQRRRNEARVSRHLDMQSRIEEFLLGLQSPHARRLTPRSEIEARASECRFPCGVVLTLDDLLDSAHLAERDVWQVIEGPNGSAIRSPRPAWHIHGDARPSLVLRAVENSDG